MTPLDRLKQMKAAAQAPPPLAPGQRKLTPDELAAIRDGKTLPGPVGAAPTADYWPELVDKLRSRVAELERLVTSLKDRVVAQSELLGQRAERADRWKKTPPSPAERDRRHQAKGRLPDKSLFELRYDAASQTWRGMLVVVSGWPPNTGNTRTFFGELDGVFKLLSQLDDQYRRELKKKEQADGRKVADGLGGGTGAAGGPGPAPGPGGTDRGPETAGGQPGGGDAGAVPDVQGILPSPE